jgi:hypothetical protein
VHKHRNLLAHAPNRLHDELSADYNDMIYVGTKQEIETKRKAFIRKWRLKCKAVADSLEEAGPNTGLPYNPPWRYTIQAEAFAPNDLAAVLRAALIEVTDMDILARTLARAEVHRAEIAEQMRALGLAAPR